MGLGRMWGGTWEASQEWAKQNNIKFIANFSHKNIVHEYGIPHVWVNIGYKGHRDMPHGTWEQRVTKAFRGMVEALSRGCDVLGQCMRAKHRTSGSMTALMALIHPTGDFFKLCDSALQNIVKKHPCGLTDADLTKIVSVWAQSDIRNFCMRLKTEPGLFDCKELDQMHKKISKGLVEHKTGKPKVRSPRSTARDSKREEATSSAVSSNVITAARGSVAVEMKSKQRQTKKNKLLLLRTPRCRPVRRKPRRSRRRLPRPVM